MKKLGLCLLITLASPWLICLPQTTAAPANMLIIACHPDDWEIGMAGTAYLLKDKFKIHVVIASDGELGNTWNTTGKPDPQIGALRVEHSAKSAKRIHATNHFFRMRDGGRLCGRECRQQTR